MAAPFDIRRVDPVVTRPVRQLILRPHQTLEELIVPGEDDDEAGWFAAYDGAAEGEVVIGTAGVFPEDRPGTGPGGWRLRAMAATTPGQGVGSSLLEACLVHARRRGGRYLWCSARTPAAGFYHRHGFVTVSDIYEPPGLGPHVTMVREEIDGPGEPRR
jgi:GNAT superfamily N-acetyltransferase